MSSLRVHALSGVAYVLPLPPAEPGVPLIVVREARKLLGPLLQPPVPPSLCSLVVERGGRGCKLANDEPLDEYVAMDAGGSETVPTPVLSFIVRGLSEELETKLLCPWDELHWRQ